jgi:hypothetical protein
VFRSSDANSVIADRAEQFAVRGQQQHLAGDDRMTSCSDP